MKYSLVYILSFFICVLLGHEATCQEQLGNVSSNYLPSSAIFMDPCASTDSKVFMQLNLASPGVFAFSNMAYLPKFSVYSLGKGLQNPVSSGFKLNQFIYANAFIDGPGIVLSTNNMGAGLFVRARSTVDVRGIPYELVDLLFQQNPNPASVQTNSIDKKNIKVSNLSWLEYGGNFAWIIKKEKREMWSIGGNLRYLSGINLFYFNINNIKGFYNDSIGQIDEIKAKLNFTAIQLNSGRGFGLDFGFSYKLMLKSVGSYFPNSKKSHCASIDYKYKLNMALRDAGAIYFTNNVTKGNLNTGGNFRTDTGATLTSATITKELNTLLYTGSAWAFLPSNLVAQFDYNFENGWFANATVVKNILPHSFTGAGSANLIAIAPRFVKKQVEVSMPITLQKFIYPQLGFYIRVRSCALGFENVFPLVFSKNTYGLGVYAKIAISLNKNPRCWRGGSGAADCPGNISIRNKFNKNIKKQRWR